MRNENILHCENLLKNNTVAMTLSKVSMELASITSIQNLKLGHVNGMYTSIYKHVSSYTHTHTHTVISYVFN